LSPPNFCVAATGRLNLPSRGWHPVPPAGPSSRPTATSPSLLVNAACRGRAGAQPQGPRRHGSAQTLPPPRSSGRGRRCHGRRRGIRPPQHRVSAATPSLCPSPRGHLSPVRATCELPDAPVISPQAALPQRHRSPVPPDRRAGPSHRRRAAASPLPRPRRGMSSPALRKPTPPSMSRRPPLPCSAGADPALAAPGGALAAPFPTVAPLLWTVTSRPGGAPQLAPCPVAHASRCSALPPAHFASSPSSSAAWLPHPCNLLLRPRGSMCSSCRGTQGSSSRHDLAGAPFPNSRRPFLSATSLPRVGLLLLARVVQPPQCFHRRA
jgi:hypothetical protein